MHSRPRAAQNHLFCFSPAPSDPIRWLQVATIIGSKHVEALTAINVELLQAALVGSASAASRNDLHSSSAAQSPEKVRYEGAGLKAGSKYCALTRQCHMSCWRASLSEWSHARLQQSMP